MAKLQTSPGNALSPSRLGPPHLRTSFPYRYRTLKILASSSSLHASYAISVRQASALPAASFRFHLAMDTLAVQLTIPPVGFVGDFHSLVRAPCGAHEKKRRPREKAASGKAQFRLAAIKRRPLLAATYRTGARAWSTAPSRSCRWWQRSKLPQRPCPSGKWRRPP